MTAFPISFALVWRYFLSPHLCVSVHVCSVSQRAIINTTVHSFFKKKIVYHTHINFGSSVITAWLHDYNDLIYNIYKIFGSDGEVLSVQLHLLSTDQIIPIKNDFHLTSYIWLLWILVIQSMMTSHLSYVIFNHSSFISSRNIYRVTVVFQVLC